ncbi:MAG: SpoIIE family protein phosphatase [Chitinispirillaceae bacterium]|nr:SpoIIE family protein phosphatase [Chitinispirillaceae bacterium]
MPVKKKAKRVPSRKKNPVIKRTAKIKDTFHLPSEGELLHMLLDNIPDAIYFKDLKSRFVRINRGWITKTGGIADNEKKVIGKTDFDFFTLEHARQAFLDEQKIIRTGKPIVGIEEKETWPDRPDTWVSTTKMPFIDKKGHTIGTFGLSRDITEVKKYRDALQRAKDELEERVKERTAELSEAKFRLEQHVEQLKFLNLTAYNLAQITNIDALFSAIGNAFYARFPFAHISVCQKTKTAFSCVYATGALEPPEARALSEKALEPFFDNDITQPQLIEQWVLRDHMKLSWPRALEEDPYWILFPLISDNATLAMVELFVARQGETIFKQEYTLLSTLASHAATCLSNALHYKYLEMRARLEGELEAARNIQQSLMPYETPKIPRLQLAGAYLPAYEVGGDYLDYFQAGDGSWVIMVADVCGKGVPAALLMSVLRSIARVEARVHFGAKELLCAVNESICLNINERSFITALALVIKSDGSSMTYARAGHAKLLRINAGRERVETIDSKGLALGIMQNVNEFSGHLEEMVLPLCAGETYLAYTDGLTEAVDEQKNAYGLPHLIQTMLELKEGNADHMINGLLTDIRLFTKNKPAHDDLTMMAMLVTG